MEKVSSMPPRRGKRGYAEQAETIRAELVLAGSPVLVATSTKRNTLETLSRYLRDFQDVTCIVSIHTKDKAGAATSHALHAEYTPAAD